MASIKTIALVVISLNMYAIKLFIDPALRWIFRITSIDMIVINAIIYLVAARKTDRDRNVPTGRLEVPK